MQQNFKNTRFYNFTELSFIKAQQQNGKDEQ